MKDEMNNRMQAKEDLGLIVVKASPRVCAPLIPICLDWKTWLQHHTGSLEPHGFASGSKTHVGEKQEIQEASSHSAELALLQCK